MKQTIKGYLQLIRFGEYAWLLVIPTILGILTAKGDFSWRVIALMIANWLMVGFSFMINDIEDAPEDAFSEDNLRQNPVAGGMISLQGARIAALSTAVLSISLYLLMGLWPFIFGTAGILLGYLFSAHMLRLKMVAFFDMLTYGLVLSGLPFLSSYYAYSDQLNDVWFWPFILVMASAVYDRLNKEMTRIPSSGLHDTAISLGQRGSSGLKLGLLILILLAGIVSFFLINIIPAWVIMAMVILTLFFLLPPVLQSHRDDLPSGQNFSYKKILERAIALALIFQITFPWLTQLLRLGIF